MLYPVEKEKEDWLEFKNGEKKHKTEPDCGHSLR